jgi:hypothetical protein
VWSSSDCTLAVLALTWVVLWYDGADTGPGPSSVDASTDEARSLAMPDGRERKAVLALRDGVAVKPAQG